MKRLLRSLIESEDFNSIVFVLLSVIAIVGLYIIVEVRY